MSNIDWATELPHRIEHTLLAQESDASAIRRVCEDALRFKFCGVCVNPAWVGLAHSFLVGQPVRLVSVAGFPLGASRTDIKVAEAAGAVEDGAQEIDLVANIGWIVGGQFDLVAAEIKKVRRNLPSEVLLKVILEVGKLSAEQVRHGVDSVVDGGAEYVKTASGLYGPTTIDQVLLLVALARGRIRVKAAGGIKTLKAAQEMIEAGADRIGTSSSVSIMAELMGAQSG